MSTPPLGRDTAATVRHWDAISSSMPLAPRLFRGPLPRKSPDNRRFYNTRYRNQWIGNCFPAGTMVRMADGSEKPIQDVKVGDRVVTHASGSRTVLNTFRRLYDGDLVTLKAGRFPFAVQATADHRFAVPDGDNMRWTKVGELTTEDKVLLGSVIPGEAKATLDVADYVPECVGIESDPTSRLNSTRMAEWEDDCAEPSRERVRFTDTHYGKSIYRKIAVTPSLGRLIGLYLAEGGIDYKSSRITWSFHRKEEHLAEDVIQILRGCFGIEAKHYYLKGRDNLRLVRVSSRTLASFWASAIPGGIDTKRVPGFIMSAPAEVRRAALAGWLDGDGCRRLKPHHGTATVIIVGVTISPELARDMGTIASTLGMRVSMRGRNPIGTRRVAYEVNLSGKKAVAMSPAFEREVADAGLLTRNFSNPWTHRFGTIAPVKEVDHTEVSGLPVYDIEVEEDHSFVANGYVVHNCVGQNVTSMVEALLRMPDDRAGDAKALDATDLTPLLTYYLARKWSSDHGVRMGDEGAIVSHAIQAIHATGMSRMETWPDTEAAEDAYSDDRPPPTAASDEAKFHPVKEYAILGSWDDMLAGLAGGFVLNIGIEIPQGFMRTADDGRFSMGGRGVGGHSITFLDYDQDQDRAYIGNSWHDAGWGMLAQGFGFGLDPATLDPRCRGRVGVGYCPLSDLEKWFSPRLMASGQSEAVVANTVDGWRPKITSFAEVM